jgi:hypothetical protein
MRKHIVGDVNGRKFSIAWLSFQPDGSISFGLQDRTYISPRSRARIGLCIAIQYVIPSDPNALEPVINPHFTFHPSVHFHLRADRDEQIFQAIADVQIVLEQDGIMPWIRAVSAPLGQLAYGGRRKDSIDVEEWIVQVGSVEASIRVELDFIKSNCVGGSDDLSRKSFVWHDIGVRVSIAFTYPQVATLSWFHSY